MVTRAVVLERAATIWPYQTVPYSMTRIHQPDGYRQDCSGFASLCWAIPPGQWGGENTESLVTKGWMSEIAKADLLPGDAVGLCGPGTLGAAGHIQIFERWTDTGLVIWEQAGGTVGPRKRTIKAIAAGYRAYRFRDIGPAKPPQEDDVSVKLINVTTGPMKGSVFKLYPTSLGMAYEPLSAELGPAVAMWGEQVDVVNPDVFGRPIAAIRAEWAAMGGTGGGGAVPFSISLTGSATPKIP
jgi:hypothetical protein